MARGRRSVTIRGGRHLSTAEAARLCGISQNSVIRSFDEGLLKGFRLPGSTARRFTRGQLRQFMEAHQIPTDRLDALELAEFIDGDDAAVTAAESVPA